MAEALVHAREGYVRGSAGCLGGVVLGGMAALVTWLMIETAEVKVGVVLMLALLWIGGIVAAFRVRPRTIEVREDAIEIRGLFRKLTVPVDAIAGLGHAWERGRVLRSSTGDVPLWRFASPALWPVIEEKILPRVAARIAAALIAGEPAALGIAQLSRGGFQLKGKSAAWSEIDGVSARPEGNLLTLKNRPGDAIVLTAQEFPDLPLFVQVGRRMQREAGDAAAPGGAPRMAAPAGAVPLRGMPADHPELGRIVFTFKRPFAAVVGMVLSSLALGVIALGSGACLAIGGDQGGVVGKFSWVLGILLLVCASALLKRRTGTSFVAYEGGLADLDAALPWSKVVSISLGSTQRSRGGSYEGTEHSITLVGPGKTRFSMRGWGPETEAFLLWFRETVVPEVARGHLDRIRAGEDVVMAGAKLGKDGIRKNGAFVGWDDYRGHRIVQRTERGGGTTTTVPWIEIEGNGASLSALLQSPNGHVLAALLDAFEAGRS